MSTLGSAKIYSEVFNVAGDPEIFSIISRCGEDVWSAAA